ncbi:MAG TPA: PAS domain S-box protein, partial [Desulfobacteraceae bacterium]|nr:PAS domain S-box protein [Desulfobacteraceae bacterium]
MKSKAACAQLERRVQALEKELADCESRNGSDRLNQRYLEAILNNTNLPIYLKNADYSYILVNRQYERLAHITNAQIRGKDDFAIFPEPVARLFRTQDEEVVRRRTLIEFEETIPLPDGARTFLTAKFPLIDDEGGVYAVGGVCTDITAHKKAEAELREAEEKFRGIFEHSPVGIVHIDKNGAITESNEKLADILGTTVKEIVGIDALKSVPVEQMRTAIVTALSGKITHYEGNYSPVAGGAQRDIHTVFSPIFSSDGAITGVMGICEDITRRRRAEDALRKAHDELEQRVAERTVQLDRRTLRLEETNIALKILLEKREEDKKELEERVMFNIEKFICPYLEKLKVRCPDTAQQAILKVIQSNLDEINSSFAHKQKDNLATLTPAQLQIADLVRQGLSTKEIALILNLSPATVACHRQEIRKRLFLTNKKINLQASLMMLFPAVI